MPHDRRVTSLFMAAGLPAMANTSVALWRAPLPAVARVTIALAVVALWVGLSVLARGQMVRPLQTVANLLAALREGDSSIRARSAAADDALGHVMVEINTLADTLPVQRLGAHEATALLGHTASELGLVGALSASSALQDLTFAGASGRWEIRRARFWQGGAPHDLLVLSDLSQPLREQQRRAWRRLIRVIGHELNNSLTPIKSIAGGLASLLGRRIGARASLRLPLADM